MKRTKRLSLSVLLLAIMFAFAAIMFAGCEEASEGGDGGAIKLSQTNISIVEGKTTTIIATSDEDVTWSVDHDDVVTITPVKKICTIKGLKPGTATVTAKAGETTATCTVTVTEDNSEKITVTLNGEAVTAAEVDMNNTITLVATASLGSPVTWESSNENVATVNGGVVTGVRPGSAVITAKVSSSIKADVTVTVKSVGGYEYYDITLKNGASDAAANPGTWAYWTEWAQFTALNYDNGTVNVEFIENGGNWYNLQLFNVNTEIDASKYYKLTVDIESNAAGHVTLNGNVLNITQGKQTYTAYFTNGTGFSMQFGVEGGINGNTATVIDIPVGKVAISNIRYEEDKNRVTLTAPSFTYNSGTGVITITDTNTAGVKHYVLNLYQNNKVVTGLTLTGSGEVDWSMVVSGTYQAKLKAVGVNVHYIDSAESEAQEIVVENEGGIHYTFNSSTPKDANGATAKQTPGIWTYWSESWVTVDGEFKDNKLTVSFSNNAGNWYDTQLNYRHPGLVNGTTYKIQLELDSTAGGRVTLNGGEFTIKEGKHVYDIVFTDNGGLSIQFTLGLDGQNNQQDIKEATFVIEIKDVSEVVPVQLVAPSFELNDQKVITITDTNEAGVGGFELGYFLGDDLKKTVKIKNGDTVDASVVVAGSYTVKLRAVGANAMYTTSAWSTTTATVVSTNQSTPVANGDEAKAVATPDTWIEWHDQNWVNSNSTVTKCEEAGDGSLTLVFTSTGSNWFSMQLFKRYSTCEDGKSYKLTLKINSSVTGNITVCGKKVELTAGDNDVEVTFTQAAGKASISIQFGVEADGTMLSGGTFVFSDINVAAA
ncbi:MAG: hypothetical protein J1F39_06745 [Clostridiales bacterium]|nr:hypothetical protein [Clostridiales bacterium]